MIIGTKLPIHCSLCDHKSDLVLKYSVKDDLAAITIIMCAVSSSIEALNEKSFDRLYIHDSSRMLCYIYELRVHNMGILHTHVSTQHMILCCWYAWGRQIKVSSLLFVRVCTDRCANDRVKIYTQKKKEKQNRQPSWRIT